MDRLRRAAVLLAIGLAAARPSPARADDVLRSCVGVPRSAPKVTVCETLQSYTFDLAGEKQAYDKAAYRSAARAAVTSWFSSHGLTPPVGARLAYWIAVPETDPRAAQGRLVLQAPLDPEHQLVAFVGVGPETFVVDDAHVGILGDASYPSSYGHRASSLVVRPAAGASESDVQALLAAYGATPAAGLDASGARTGAVELAAAGASYLAYQVGVFAEASTAKAAMADARAATLVSGIELNSFFEWIASREQAFAFSLEGP
jgi:hypothetical protein